MPGRSQHARAAESAGTTKQGLSRTGWLHIGEQTRSHVQRHGSAETIVPQQVHVQIQELLPSVNWCGYDSDWHLHGSVCSRENMYDIG